MKTTSKTLSAPEANAGEVERYLRKQEPRTNNLFAGIVISPEERRSSLKDRLEQWRKEAAKRPAVADLRTKIREAAILLFPEWFETERETATAEAAVQDSPWLREHPDVAPRLKAKDELKSFVGQEYGQEAESIIQLLETAEKAVSSLRDVKNPQGLILLLEKLAEQGLCWIPKNFRQEDLKQGFKLQEKVVLPYQGNDLSLVVWETLQTVSREVMDLYHSPEAVAQREEKGRALEGFRGRADINILEAVEGKAGTLVVRIQEQKTNKEAQYWRTGHILLEIQSQGRAQKTVLWRPLQGFEYWLQWAANYATYKDGKSRWFRLVPPEFRVDKLPQNTVLDRLINGLIAPALQSWYEKALEAAESRQEQAELRARAEEEKQAALTRRKELLAEPGITPVELLEGKAGRCKYRLHKAATRSRGPDDLTISVESDGENLVLNEYVSTMAFSLYPEKAIDLTEVVGREIPLSTPKNERESGPVRSLRAILHAMAGDCRIREIQALSEITATELFEGKKGVCAFVIPKAQIGDSRGILVLCFERKRKNGPVWFQRYTSPDRSFSFDHALEQKVPLAQPGETGAIRHLKRFLEERKGYESWKASQYLAEESDASVKTS